MNKFLKKMALLSVFCGVVLNANEIPQPLKDVISSMKSAEFYYDTVLSFGDTKIFTPIKYDDYFGADKKLREAVKINIDDNKTYQEKLAKFRQNGEDFCGNFFDDFKEFKNIEIKKPIAKEVPYHDETFREYMGQCYYMGMDWFAGNHRLWLQDDYEFSPKTVIKPYSYTLYETNFLGKNNLFLIQNFDYFRDAPNFSNTERKFSNMAVLNSDMCEAVFKNLKNQSDFNMFKDRKTVGGEKTYSEVGVFDEYRTDNTHTKTNFNILNYKGQDYVFIIEKFENNHINAELIENFRKEYRQDTADEDWLQEHKCQRNYF